MNLNWGKRLNGTEFTTPFHEFKQTHGMITGGTGSGKSSSIQRIVSQIAANNECCLIVLDPGMSNPLYATYEETTRHREHERFFTDSGLDGLHFDPLYLPDEKRDPLSAASHLSEGVNIANGLDYGQFFFYMASFASIVDAYIAIKKKGNTPNLHTLVDALEKQGFDFKDGQLVKYCCKSLLLYPQLQTDGVPEEKILRLGRVLERRQCLYVGAPCMGGNSSSRQILSLILGCLLMEAMARKAASKPLVPVVVILEEASFIVSSFTDTFLNTARKFGISVILTAQHSGQFASGDRDVLTTIRMCCGLKIMFTASQEEREFIAEESLDRLVRYRSGQDDSMSVVSRESWRELREPSFSLNRIKRISGTKQHAVAMWNTDGKFSNPRHIIVPYYSKTLADHERLEMYPFPRRSVAIPEPVLTPSGTVHLAPLTHPDALVRQKAVEELQTVLLNRIIG